MSAPGRYYEPEIETADRDAIRALQRERLAAAIDHTLSRSKFTQELWRRAGLDSNDVTSLEDFIARAPMFVQSEVTKWADMHDDPYGGLLCIDADEITRIDTTSGTTGLPLAIPQYDGNPREIATLRDFAEDQVEPGGVFVRMVPISRNGFAHPLTDALGVRAVWLDHSQQSIPAFVDACVRYRPGAVHLLSRPLLVGLQEYATERNLDLADVLSSYHAVTYGGEPLSEKDRAQFEEWGVRVRVHTSCGNTVAALECLEGDGAHTWEDLLLIEVLDPETGEPVAEGKIGEMVVTTLYERATPLLRFRTEDLVRYTSERCRCGRTHGRIWTIGRTGDGVRVAGQLVLPYSLMPVFSSIPETSACLFQILVKPGDTDVLRLRVGCTTDSPPAGLGERIRLQILEELDVSSEIEFVTNAALISTGPGYKIQRIVKL